MGPIQSLRAHLLHSNDFYGWKLSIHFCNPKSLTWTLPFWSVMFVASSIVITSGSGGGFSYVWQTWQFSQYLGKYIGTEYFENEWRVYYWNTLFFDILNSQMPSDMALRNIEKENTLRLWIDLPHKSPTYGIKGHTREGYMLEPPRGTTIQF